MCPHGWIQRNRSAPVIATSVGRRIFLHWTAVLWFKNIKWALTFSHSEVNPSLPPPATLWFKIFFRRLSAKSLYKSLFLMWLAFNLTNNIKKQAIIQVVEGHRNFFLMSWYAPSQLDTTYTENRGGYQAMWFLLWGKRQDFLKPFPFWRQKCATSF